MKETISKEKKNKTTSAFSRAFGFSILFLIIGSIWVMISDFHFESALLCDANHVNVFIKICYIMTATVVVFCVMYIFFKKTKAMKTNLEKEKQQLLESERRKFVLLDNLPGMAYRCHFDRNRTMQFISQGCFELTGYETEDLLHNKAFSFNHLISPEHQDYLWNQWNEALRAKAKLKEEYPIVTATGETKWVFEQGEGVFDEEGNAISLEGFIIDITKRKKQEMMQIYLNEHDSLTGLYNHRKYEEFMAQELQQTRNKRALILVNLRKYNFLLSIFGYKYCEDLIREIAVRLTEMCHDRYRLFHIFIDRFVIYIDNLHESNELMALCQKIIDVLTIHFASKTLGGNIGVVEIDYTKSDSESILKSASIAAENGDMDQIFSYSFFNKDMEKRILRESIIKSELSDILYDTTKDRLYLLYQPIVNLKTNRISGFEALARMNSDEYGLVSPNEFIPIAERAQLIAALGKRIMHKAMRFLKTINDRGYPDIYVSINVSPIQLMRDDFLSDLLQAINNLAVDPNNIVIEITESAFSGNYQQINNKLDVIQKLGIKIAIDDFGTGYSSLARERELNVNCLKIDKYFIDKLDHLDRDVAITGDIISMAHKLGHSVIAEGVENEKQKEYLIDFGCDYVQGYLFSKPVPEEEAVKLIKP